MALNIIRTLEDQPARYRRFAVVKTKKVSPFGKLFGARAGSVSVSLKNGAEQPLFFAVPPVWKNDTHRERTILKQCYEQILRLAEQHHCQALFIPLLTAEDPGFPAHIDFSIAVEVMDRFCVGRPMDVYLTAAGKPLLKHEVERFLRVNSPDGDLFFHRSAVDLEAPDFESFCACVQEEPILFPPQQAGSMGSPDDMALPRPAPTAKKAKTTGRMPLPPAPRKSVTAGATPARPSKAELEAMLRATDAGFSETLLKLIDQSGKKDSEIYTRANVSRQHFSKIRNNPGYKPTKPTAIAFAIALELDMDQTRDLIGRAGFTLTTSSKFDMIIMYFIQRHHYNMYDINETLYEFDQNLLGA